MAAKLYMSLIIALILGAVFVNSLAGLYIFKMIYYSIAMIGMIALTIGYFHANNK